MEVQREPTEKFSKENDVCYIVAIIVLRDKPKF